MSERIVKLPRRGFICETCGEVGFPKKQIKGSFLITVFLLLLFVSFSLVLVSDRIRLYPKKLFSRRSRP